MWSFQCSLILRYCHSAEESFYCFLCKQTPWWDLNPLLTPFVTKTFQSLHPALFFSFQRAKPFWLQFSGKVGKIHGVTHSVNVSVDNHMKEKRDFLIPNHSPWCTPDAHRHSLHSCPSFQSWCILCFCIWRSCQDALICPCSSHER